MWWPKSWPLHGHSLVKHLASLAFPYELTPLAKYGSRIWGRTSRPWYFYDAPCTEYSIYTYRKMFFVLRHPGCWGWIYSENVSGGVSAGSTGIGKEHSIIPARLPKWSSSSNYLMERLMVSPWRRQIEIEKKKKKKKRVRSKTKSKGKAPSGRSPRRCASNANSLCYQYIQVQYQMHAIAPKWADGVSVPASSGLQRENIRPRSTSSLPANRYLCSGFCRIAFFMLYARSTIYLDDLGLNQGVFGIPIYGSTKGVTCSFPYVYL